MAIQDDWTIDYVDRKITYTPAFVDDRPPNIYTVNELYSYLQDTFDEPAQMDDPVPMSAQTPTQYTLINKWFIDDNSMKALYGGSIQTSTWTFSASEGITQLRWADSPSVVPDTSDVGEGWIGQTSTASGIVLYVDSGRQVAWLRNLDTNQFQDGEQVLGPASDPDFNTEATNGFQSGESVWANLFSVGSLQAQTEVYVGQEDNYQGGTSYHTTSGTHRQIQKIDEWWDSDVDFATGSPNLLGGAGHFDLLVKTQEAGTAIDGSRLAVFARQASKVYSHFELVGGVGNFVVPFASTGADLNAADGPYRVSFDGRAGTTMAVGDVLENGTTSPAGRLRAVVTAVTGGDQATGTIDYYLIGENEPAGTADRTLRQLSNNDNLVTRGSSTNDFEVNGGVTQVGPSIAQGITVTFGNAQYDINEDTVNEEYACTIDCNNVALADVYKRVMFLTCRGNQDGTVADTQDELLPSASDTESEPGEFYRAVGDIIFNWDTKLGSAITEGLYVENAGATATGVVVSISGTSGSSGICVLTQVKGTWADGDVVAFPGQHASDSVAVNEPSGVTSIVDNTAAPFGTFAGGRWFVAKGVVLTNVPSADNNNWETVGLGSTTAISPPTTITITFAGLVANDRAALFEVNTAGGIDIRKNQNGVASGGAVSDTGFELDNTVALDVPTTGWVRIVDSSSATGQEFRYEYSAISATTVTLRTGAGLTGTTTSAGTSTVLNDTGAFSSYGSNGNVKTGMMIRNVSSAGWAIVLRKIDNDSIETTVLSTGTWTNAVGWEANQIVVALDAADTTYFGFIDDEASGTSLTKSIKYVENTDLIARARFSDPDVGGTRILPFEQKSITLTNADLTVTAIRTTDTIVS